MPELPDLQVFGKNLSKHFAGKKLEQIKVVNGAKLKDSQAALKKSLEGVKLHSVYRSGKELRFEFDNDNILGLHLMLHGELKLFDEKNDHKNTIVELLFSNDKGFAVTDWQGLANVKLNPTDKQGVDALSKELDQQYLEEALQTKAIIKNVLMDQDIIRGIGNAYADEILWEAGISPFSKSNKIPAGKIKELARVIKSVLQDAEKQILKKKPDLISGEVRDFLVIHNSKKKESPTGSPILTKMAGGRKTYYTEEQQLFE
jgi:formamidopyrimidine-DNA glycosylase